jgi:hypothetical protein
MEGKQQTWLAVRELSCSASFAMGVTNNLVISISFPVR